MLNVLGIDNLINQFSSQFGKKAEVDDLLHALKSESGEKFIDEITDRIMKCRDKDEDGALSMEEFGLGAKIFNEFDTNNDAQITKDEIKSTLEKTKNAIMNLNDMVEVLNNLPSPAKVKEMLQATGMPVKKIHDT